MDKSFVFPLLLAAGLAVEGAQADALAVDLNGSDSGGSPTRAQTNGYAFTVANGFQYTVTALGVIDVTVDGDGLVDDHPVGIWSGDGSTLLASTTLPSGTSSTVVPFGGPNPVQWRFVDLAAPVVLGPGNYLIGAYHPGNGASGDSWLTVENPNLSSLTITLSGITVTEGRRFVGASLTAPTQTDDDRGFFGPSFLVEQAIVNPDLTVAVSGQSTNTTPVSEGPAGVFSFTATFCNKTASPTLEALVSSTRVLTNGNSLVNRDRDGTGTPAGGVGSELDFPLDPDYDDGLLAAGECVDVPYEIGLAERKRFSFNVDLLGVDAP